MVASRIPIKSTLKAIGTKALKVDSISPVTIPGVKAIGLATTRQKGAAIGNMIGGAPGELGARVAGRGIKTSYRAYNQGVRGVKKQSIGFVRGATTSITKNRRLLGDVATGGALSIGGTVNRMVANSPFGRTNLGKLLTTDISAPIYKAAKIRTRLRNVTNGVFNEYQKELIYI